MQGDDHIDIDTDVAAQADDRMDIDSEDECMEE